MGRYSVPRKSTPPADRFSRQVEKTESCWLWKAFIRPNGYGDFYFENRSISAHRYSWMLHFGPIPPGLYVLHKCDVRHCVNPEHLFLGTAADNAHDAIRKGRFPVMPFESTFAHPDRRPIGELNHSAKLTSMDVLEIRRLYSTEKRSLRELAGIFHVSKQTIHRIVNRQNWSHLP